jgi:hypothetical protein
MNTSRRQTSASSPSRNLSGKAGVPPWPGIGAGADSCGGTLRQGAFTILYGFVSNAFASLRVDSYVEKVLPRMIRNQSTGGNRLSFWGDQERQHYSDRQVGPHNWHSGRPTDGNGRQGPGGVLRHPDGGPAGEVRLHATRGLGGPGGRMGPGGFDPPPGAGPKR